MISAKYKVGALPSRSPASEIEFTPQISKYQGLPFPCLKFKILMSMKDADSSGRHKNSDP